MSDSCPLFSPFFRKHLAIIALPISYSSSSSCDFSPFQVSKPVLSPLEAPRASVARPRSCLSGRSSAAYCGMWFSGGFCISRLGFISSVPSVFKSLRLKALLCFDFLSSRPQQKLPDTNRVQRIERGKMDIEPLPCFRTKGKLLYHCIWFETILRIVVWKVSCWTCLDDAGLLRFGTLLTTN